MNDWLGTLQVRVARPSRDLRATTAFYCEGVGLTVLASWEGHDGYDGVVLRIPGGGRQLELLKHSGVVPTPTSEDQLVLYLGSNERVSGLVDRIRAAGHEPTISPNPYWTRKGATCFVDPDGYWLVLSPESWASPALNVGR